MKQEFENIISVVLVAILRLKNPTRIYSTLLLRFRARIQTHHTGQDSCGRGICPSQRLLTTHNFHKRHISMPLAGFEPAATASERP